VQYIAVLAVYVLTVMIYYSCADLTGDIPTGLRLNYDSQLILMMFLNRDAPIASVGETTA